MFKPAVIVFLVLLLFFSCSALDKLDRIEKSIKQPLSNITIKVGGPEFPIWYQVNCPKCAVTCRLVKGFYSSEENKFYVIYECPNCLRLYLRTVKPTEKSQSEGNI